MNDLSVLQQKMNDLDYPRYQVKSGRGGAQRPGVPHPYPIALLGVPRGT